MTRKFSPQNPCPICGCPDWCMEIDSRAGTLVSCHRAEGYQSNEKIRGKDGRTYYYLYTKNGCALFEEESQHIAYETELKNRYAHVKNNNTKYKDEYRYEFINDCIDKSNTVSYTSKISPNDETENTPSDPDGIHAAYSYILAKLPFLQKDRNALIAEGWSDDMADHFGAKSGDIDSGTRKQLAKDAKEMAECPVPGIYKATYGYDMNLYKGLVIPQRNLDGKITALRLRPSELDAKYLYFSSYKKNAFGENMYEEGAKAHAGPSFYKGNDLKTLLVTEGEKKAYVASVKLKSLCVSIPGVGMTSTLVPYLDTFKKMGVKKVVICLDADKIQNKNVLQAEKNLIEMFSKAGFLVYKAEWNIQKGKGIDDLLLGGNLPKIVKASAQLKDNA